MPVKQTHGKCVSLDKLLVNKISIDDEDSNSPAQLSVPLEVLEKKSYSGSQVDLFNTSEKNFLDIPIMELESLVIKILFNSPNNTCIEENITTRILKDLSINTRGTPRNQFEKKVNKAIRNLIIAGRVYQYKSKNKRIGLVK